MPIDTKGSAGVCGVQYEPGTFDDPNWTNPGRCDRERAFFERKRQEHLVLKGRPTPDVPAAGASANPKPSRTQGARLSGRKRRKPVFGAAPRAFLGGKMRRKIIEAAEAFERRTKRKGKKNGLLGASGLNVLRAMLFRFHSAQGQTYPSYTALQEATGLCRQTIAECIERLERHGFLKVVNRIKRVVDDVLGLVRAVQTSNAYTMHLPANLDGSEASDAPRRPFPERRAAPEAVNLLRRLGIPLAEPPSLDCSLKPPTPLKDWLGSGT